MSERFVVTVAVPHRNGTVERVKVGTAVRRGAGFQLELGSLTLEPETAEVTAVSKLRDLEYIAERARKILADPHKARWHAQEREILTSIEDELARQRGQPDARSI